MTVTGRDGAFTCLVRRPVDQAQGEGPRPAVIVIQEIFGVNRNVVEIAEGLAANGFYAVAPDLFWRTRSGIDLDDRKPQDLERAFELYRGFDPQAGVADIAATLEAVRRLPGVNGKAGVVGHCLGGLLSFLTAEEADPDCAVVYYGGGMDQHLGKADEIGCPILIHLGGADEYIGPDAQEGIRATFDGVTDAEVHVYPGRGHAFARTGGDHYDAGDARTADQRTHDFLRLHLG
ncbi:MAG: dienelactone hydrolase family protein [Caulobacteraceae bacterium]|nr:dienelactone hydrolase family protein [Caulobacter sp.]